MPPAGSGSVVVLIAPPPSEILDGSDGSDTIRFVPVVCELGGKRETGARCGEAMPADATVSTRLGELAVHRATASFHDGAGEQDYAAPYGPACCMYNTCVERTVPYFARGAEPRGIVVAVWPPGADAGLDESSAGSAVTMRGVPPGPRGYKLIASTDIDHDGARERLVYEVWANDYGIDVVDATGSAIYAFSCGNI